jgi:2-polyprenyl-3-methyl-5-hydroxy-6-metoxy-1,4-benzoquinol methylase
MNGAASDPCALCGEKRGRVLSRSGRRGKALVTVACAGCGLARVDPMPAGERLKEFYEREYRLDYKGVRQPKPHQVFRAGCLAVERFKTAADLLPAHGRILDIGCGAGEWLYVLGRRGYQARGLEADPGYASFGRRELGVEVDCETAGEAQFGEGAFEAITMFHVLEHLREPLEVLRRCREWLAESGVLVLEVPNIASRHQHPVKRFHEAHLYGFTPETLALAAARAGFVKLRLTLDRFERNILGMFRKGGTCGDAGDAGIAVEFPDLSLWRYYLTPLTYFRFLLRMQQFVRERRAVHGSPPPRVLLDRLMASDL